MCTSSTISEVPSIRSKLECAVICSSTGNLTPCEAFSYESSVCWTMTSTEECAGGTRVPNAYKLLTILTSLASGELPIHA